MLAEFGRQEVADYVSALFTVYLIVIFIRILLSWVPRLPHNRALLVVVKFVHEVTDPYLNIFRKVIPPMGMLDLSPIVAILALYLVSGVLVGVIEG